MAMSLDDLWRMSYESPTIDIMRNSKYAIPVIQSFHLFGITLLLSGAVILNFRLLGLGFRQVPMETLAKQVWRIMIGGLVLALISGFFVFLPDPARYAANTAFRVKMLVLAAALVFQFAIFRRVVRAEASRPVSGKWLVAALSLCLWFLVGWAGRAIAFLG